MDERLFARQLCAWLDPRRLYLCASDIDRLRAMREQPARGSMQARAFRDPQQVGLNMLFLRFLANFELDEHTLALVASAAQFNLSKDAVHELTGLRYRGRVSFSDFAADDPAETVCVLSASTLELSIVAGPLNFLVHLVDSIAAMWLPRSREIAFYESSLHTEFAVYVESVVARALGFHIETAFRPARMAMNTRPNGAMITMVGQPPFDRELVAASVAEAFRRTAVDVGPKDAADAAPTSFEPHDGFILLDPEQAAEPWRNIEHYGNECSPWSGVHSPVRRPDGKLIVDSHYGHAFDFVLSEDSAVYGRSEALTRLYRGLDESCLRIPYRVVPRIPVSSREQVEAIVQQVRDQSHKSFIATEILFRGQTCEHYIGRSPAALRALYGDPHALEPSLPASATRKQQPLEDVLPEWCLLIRAYLMGLATRLEQTTQNPEILQALETDRIRLEKSLDTHILGLSLAQHYGLPSMGLDLTDRLDIALFFALTSFERVEQRRLRPTAQRPPEPVLYVLSLPERFSIEHARARPRVFPKGRPDAQNAWFSGMGWGLHRNQCAEYLAAALYLDPVGDYGELPQAADLFPEQPNDPFGSLLESLLQNSQLSVELRRYLEQLYWVLPQHG